MLSQRVLTISMLAHRLSVTAEEGSQEVRVDITLTEEQVDDWLYVLTVQEQEWHGKREEARE